MQSRGLFSMLGVGLALALIAAGCGGGDSEEIAVAADVSKTTYMKRAEAVCRETDARIKAGYEDFLQKHGGPRAFENEELSTEFGSTVLLPERQKQMEELRKLTAPEADKEEVEAILAAYQEGIDVGEEDAEAVMSSQGVFAYAGKLAEDYGFRVCRR